MPAGRPKGTPKTGGRAPGVPNKATSSAREAIAMFVDANVPRLQGWLDEIAETKGPDAAYRCVLDLIEYHIPKLARTELTGKDGQDIVTRFVIETHDGAPPPRAVVESAQVRSLESPRVSLPTGSTIDAEIVKE